MALPVWFLPLLLALTVAPEHRASLQAIEGRYAELARGFAARDTVAILAVRAADFEALLPNGERIDSTRMAAVLGGFFVLNLSPIEARYTIQAIAFPRADSAVAEVLQQVQRGQMLAGKRRVVLSDVLQTETWVRRKGRWWFRAVHDIRDPHRWVDGKRIDPTKPYDPAAPAFAPSDTTARR